MSKQTNLDVLCRVRYLAATAVAIYVGLSEPKSSALASVGLPGQLSNMEPADWLHYLCGGFNFPDLVSKVRPQDE